MKERDCKRCGRKQLHWARVPHPTAIRLVVLLVNRKGVIHECQKKFKVKLKPKSQQTGISK